MTVYVLAQLKFTNIEAYRRYEKAFPAVFKRFNGQLLTADESPMVLEGHWSLDKVVLMSFPDAKAAGSFLDDPDYQTISLDRKAGADAIVLLVKGVR